MSNIRIKNFYSSSTGVIEDDVNSWIEEEYQKEKIFIDFPNSTLFVKEIIKEYNNNSHYITIIYEAI